MNAFTYSAVVYNVVDGDTVDVEIDLGFKISTKQRIRLHGIDTPERGQPGYQAAADRLKALLVGRAVTLVTSKVSKFGYYVGVITSQGVNINDLMVAEGLATPYDGGTKL